MKMHQKRMCHDRICRRAAIGRRTLVLGGLLVVFGFGIVWLESPPSARPSASPRAVVGRPLIEAGYRPEVADEHDQDALGAGEAFDAAAALERFPLRDGYREVAFQQLGGFAYEPFMDEDIDGLDPELARGEIPDRVRVLDQQPAVLAGYMTPVDLDDGTVKHFLLAGNQLMCCFGVRLGMNEWVWVEMEGRTEFVPDELIEVYGRMEVGEKLEDGIVISIYRLIGERADAIGTFR